MKELIIESPGLQSALPRTLSGFALGAFWMLWFYLWLPLFTLLGWVFSGYSIMDQFWDNYGFIELLRLFPYYLLVIGTSGLVLIGWSLFQYHRFHGKERRKASAALTSQEVAEGLGLTVEQTLGWTDARRMVAHHDGDGRVIAVDLTAIESVSAPEIALDAAPEIVALKSIEPERVLTLVPKSEPETSIRTEIHTEIRTEVTEPVDTRVTAADSEEQDTAPPSPQKRRHKRLKGGLKAAT